MRVNNEQSFDGRLLIDDTERYTLYTNQTETKKKYFRNSIYIYRYNSVS